MIYCDRNGCKNNSQRHVNSKKLCGTCYEELIKKIKIDDLKTEAEWIVIIDEFCEIHISNKKITFDEFLVKN